MATVRDVKLLPDLVVPVRRNSEACFTKTYLTLPPHIHWSVAKDELYGGKVCLHHDPNG